MKLRASFLLPALLFAANSLYAGNLAPACVSNTLSAYERINSDSTCSVGILNFDSFFGFSAVGTGGAVPLTAAQIELTPCTGVSLRNASCVVDPTSQSGGFSISSFDPVANPFSVGAGQTETYTIDWRFVIDNGPEDAGGDMGMDPVFGNVSATQTYCVDSSLNSSPFGCYFDFPAGQVAPQTISVDDSNPPTSLINSVTFGNPALVFAEVQTVITLTGGSDGAGFDAVTGTADIVNVTPEPAAFLLVTGGLLLIGALRKRAARA